MSVSTFTDSTTLALPASAGQQRFWVLDQLHPGEPSLNVAVRFGLTGQLDPGLLGRALNQIIERHEILRATFEMYEGQVVQVVAPELKIPVELTDLRHLPKAQRTAEADRLAEMEARAPFSLAEGPLLRAGLLRVDDEEHVLLITIHHIISDGWSIGVITGELGSLYEALVERQPAPLPELAIQYADYTIWEEENRDMPAWREAAEYWKQQLADLPPFEIRPDRERSGGPADGHIVSRLLPFELTDRLRELSQKNEATLFMTMLAALATLLHRYTGETDIVLGSQVVGRNNVEVEPLIGPFINTLVLRADTGGDPAFTALLGRMRAMVSDALAYQSFPLDKVAETLRLERSIDRNLLFQINFIYQRDFVHPWEHGGVRMRAIPSKSPGAMYDLNVFLVERAEGWRVSCEYNTALYFPETVARLLEHLECLLGAILKNPHSRISGYQFLGREEESRLLYGWNRTAADYPRASTLPELFDKQALRTPDAVAILCRGESLTYARLNARVNQMARYLRQLGVAAGSLVGISLARSIDMLVSALAVMKAGGAYVPLDPGFPAERLAFMAQDAGLCLSIEEAWLADARAGVARHESGPLDDIASPEDLAYVIYTSGSTGKPKGVTVHHQALVNLLSAVVREPGLASSDVLLAITTLSFDISALELFAPLICGARILLATREEASDSIALRNLLLTGKPSVLQATPATWRMLLDAGWQCSRDLKMLCGGEPLTRDLADALLERGGELWNMYGPTETTIWSSWKRMERDGEPVTIGGPAPNQWFYVLDEGMSLAPQGVAGELYIGGEGVARGYHNRPELTAERFLKNPFGPGRIYKTGDRARWRPDRSIEILGRADSQVKLRGYRIELGEVEAALTACPMVRSAAVVVRGDSLSGYFVPVNWAADSVAAVRAYIQKRLPDYMIPTHLMALAELPRTPNGKLDRKALPDPEAGSASEAPRALEAPKDALEATLTGIWESVLPVRSIRRTDNFFEIGGHSMLAARMFARMEKVLGKTLPLATLFQGPTIEKLAGLLRDAGWTPPWSSLVPIRPGGTRPPFFFVHAIGGNVLNFAGFAGHFDTDQPVYGLQARGLDGKEAPHTTVERMAEDYIREIRAVQPAGPYYIGGFSAGGVVAYEMARGLRAAGEEVGVLALLDSKMEGQVAENTTAAWSRRFARWARTLRFNFRYAFQIGPGDFVRRKLQNWKMRWTILRWQKGGQHTLGAEEGFLFALRQYRPQPYEGDAILFRAREELVRYPDPNLGWGEWVRGGVAIREISGDHDTLLAEPNIGMLAKVLDECLHAAQTNSRIPVEV